MDAARSAVARHADRDLAACSATRHDDMLVVLPTGTRFHAKEAVVGFPRDVFTDPDWSQDMVEPRFATTGDPVSTPFRGHVP